METNTFYAVYVPSQSVGVPSDQQGSVFTTFNDARAFLNQHKDHKPRFKSFTNAKLANDFAVGKCVVAPTALDLSPQAHQTGRLDSPRPYKPAQTSSSSTVAEEKPLPYSAPSRSDLTRLRKAIEQKDDDLVEELVESNPRYLINPNSDSPTILFEGCRYNALHIAAKVGNLHACELILRLFGSSDPSYVKALYVDDPLSVCMNRQGFILDMYLNTPDKGAHETPLHFSAKYGHWDIVRLLYSVPGCQRDAKNKYGETAAGLAKGRKNKSIESVVNFSLNDDLQQATSTYVGLYRSNESSVPYIKPPSLGFPPTALDDDEHDAFKIKLGTLGLNVDTYSLVAYAGPMTPDVAKTFFAAWSGRKVPLTPASSPLRFANDNSIHSWQLYVSNYKKRDPRKGAERSGCELAHQFNTPWRELWPFLGKYCDLASEEGQTLFESYLNDKQLGKSCSPDPDALAEKLTLALPSPFFNHLPRTPKKRVKKRLHFETEDDNVEADDEIYFDTSETIFKMSSLDFNDNYKTPPESPPFSLISDRSKPGQQDYDAYHALNGCHIDSQCCPQLKRWFDKMKNIFSLSVQDPIQSS